MLSITCDGHVSFVKIMCSDETCDVTNNKCSNTLCYSCNGEYQYISLYSHNELPWHILMYIFLATALLSTINMLYVVYKQRKNTKIDPVSHNNTAPPQIDELAISNQFKKPIVNKKVPLKESIHPPKHNNTAPPQIDEIAISTQFKKPIVNKKVPLKKSTHPPKLLKNVPRIIT